MNERPPFFTVEEAAEIVRIGRTLAYQLAARFEATNGAEGLPVLRIGRLLRVPRAALETWAGAELTATTPHPRAALPACPPTTRHRNPDAAHTSNTSQPSSDRAASPAVPGLTVSLNEKHLNETAWKADALAPEVSEPGVNVSNGRWQRC